MAFILSAMVCDRVIFIKKRHFSLLLRLAW